MWTWNSTKHGHCHCVFWFLSGNTVFPWRPWVLHLMRRRLDVLLLFSPPVLHLKIHQINSFDALLIPSSATCQAPKINSFHPPSSLSAAPRAPLIALMPCHLFPPPFLHHKSVPLMSCHPVPPPFLHHKSVALMSCHPVPPPFLHHKSVALMSCHPVPPPFLHHKSVALMSCHPVPPPFLHHKSVALMSCHPVPPPFLHHKFRHPSCTTNHRFWYRFALPDV